MKRTALVTLALVILLSQAAFALENGFMEIRSKIFTEAQEIKPLLATTKDIILVNSMWDSCAMTISQLDAYFSQVGIFNVIRKEDVSDAAINFLIRWLKEIKNTDDLNITSLNSINQQLEDQTELHRQRLSGYFVDLNKQIDIELDKLSTLRDLLLKK